MTRPEVAVPARSRAALLPGRPARPVRQGPGRRRRGHPRPGGRRRRRAGKDAARAELAASDLDPARVIVRVNATGTAEHPADLAALRRTGYRTVMLPKSGEPRAAQRVRRQLARRGALRDGARHRQRGPRSPRRRTSSRVMWGAEDLIASMRGLTSRFPDGRYRDVALHARSAVLLAASARGRPAIDAVYVNIPDLDGLAAESQDAAASGFTLKACIHPSQVTVVRKAFQRTRRRSRGPGGC